MAESNRADDRPATLRLTRCADCGYPFTGLPDAGICPECGVGYDSGKMMLLFGWAVGGRSNLSNARAWWKRVVSIILIVIVLETFVFRFTIPLRAIGIGAILLFVVWQAALRRRAIAALGAPTQVRLTTEGFAQRDGVGPGKLRPWTLHTEIRLQRVQGELYRLFITPSRGFPISEVELEFELPIEQVRAVMRNLEMWSGRPVERNFLPAV
jgi:hypothetical protein